MENLDLQNVDMFVTRREILKTKLLKSFQSQLKFFFYIIVGSWLDFNIWKDDQALSSFDL